MFRCRSCATVWQDERAAKTRLMPTSIDCTSGLAGPWIGMPGTRTPFAVPPAANSRRHCPSDFEPPAHVGMRGSPFIRW